jgi:hypothetical protein
MTMAVNAWRNELDQLVKQRKLRRKVATAMILAGAGAIIGVLYVAFGPAALLLVGGALLVLCGISVLGE